MMMLGGSRALIDDVLFYLCGCESFIVSLIENTTTNDLITSIETSASIDANRLLNDAPHVRILQVQKTFTFPQPPPLTLRKPHPNIKKLITFRPISAQTIAILPTLRFM